MNNPLEILQTLDRHLSKPAELTVFGRSALALGFHGSQQDYWATQDVDLPHTVPIPRFRYMSCLLSVIALMLIGCKTTPEAFSPSPTQEGVGQIGVNRYYTPANQILTPAGRQVELPGLRPQALALSPDGRLLVTAGKTRELIVIEARSGKILQQVPLPPESGQQPAPGSVPERILQPDKDAQVSFTGLVFSPDGSRIYLANVNGSIKVFGVEPGHKVLGLSTFPLPPADAPRREAEIPAGIAVSADGRRLYVALNLSNRLAELDALTGRVLRLWEAGAAPFDVVLAGHKAYVSNWGGRRPDTNSLTGPAGQGTFVCP